MYRLFARSPATICAETRALLVELSWGWLRLQPDSALSQWFNRRFATGGKRMRRVGIAALARRLAIALWRYLEHGESRTGRCSSHPPPEAKQTRSSKRLGMERIMIKGRRARNDRGSQHSDRVNRWGAPVTGVCQRTLCACCIGCWVNTPCTDRSSSKHWLERSSQPDLGSECIGHFESRESGHQASPPMGSMSRGP